MAIKLGELFYQFTSKGFEKTQGQIDQADVKAKKAGTTLGSLKTALLALGSTAVIYAIKKLVDEFVAYGEEIDKANKITGVSVEKLQELKYACDQEHASFEQLQNSFKILTKHMGSAKRGSEESIKAFRDIESSAINVDGSLRDVYDVFLDVTDAIRNAKSPTEAADLALKFLGKSGSEMVPFLRLGREELEKLYERARDLGIVLDAETIKGIKAFSDSMTELKTAITGLKFTLAKELTGPAKEFIDWLVKTYIWLKKVETEQLIRNTELEIKHLSVAFDQGLISLGDYNKKLIELYDKLQKFQGTAAEFSVYPRVIATETDKAKKAVFEITDAMREKYKLYKEWLELENALIERQGIYTEGLEAQAAAEERRKKDIEDMDPTLEGFNANIKKSTGVAIDLADALSGPLVNAFGSIDDVLFANTMTWYAWGEMIVKQLIAVGIQLLALTMLVKFLEALGVPAGALLSLGQKAGLYQTPGGDAFAYREGRDFGRFFFQGFGEQFNRTVGNLGSRMSQPAPIIVVNTGDPSTFVEFASRMPPQYKSKFFRKVTKQGARLDQ